MSLLDEMPRRVVASKASGPEPETADQTPQEEVKLLEKLLRSYQREQKLVAYEIYDGLVQRLAAALWQLQSSHRPLGQGPNEGQEALDEGLQLVRDGMVEANKLIHRLGRPLLDEHGIEGAIDNLLCEGEHDEGLDIELVHDVHLESAMQSLVREAEGLCGSDIEFIHDVRFDRLALPLETAIFRIVQEALTDAQGFIGSGTVHMTMAEEDDLVYVEVQSWEVALDWQQAEDRRVRLERIRRQAELLGGRVTIDSVTDEATRIAVELPLLEMVAVEADPKPQ